MDGMDGMDSMDGLDKALRRGRGTRLRTRRGEVRRESVRCCRTAADGGGVRGGYGFGAANVALSEVPVRIAGRRSSVRPDTGLPAATSSSVNIASRISPPLR